MGNFAILSETLASHYIDFNLQLCSLVLFVIHLIILHKSTSLDPG